MSTPKSRLIDFAQANTTYAPGANGAPNTVELEGRTIEAHIEQGATDAQREKFHRLLKEAFPVMGGGFTGVNVTADQLSGTLGQREDALRVAALAIVFGVATKTENGSSFQLSVPEPV